MRHCAMIMSWIFLTTASIGCGYSPQPEQSFSGVTEPADPILHYPDWKFLEDLNRYDAIPNSVVFMVGKYGENVGTGIGTLICSSTEGRQFLLTAAHNLMERDKGPTEISLLTNIFEPHNFQISPDDLVTHYEQDDLILYDIVDTSWPCVDFDRVSIRSNEGVLAMLSIQFDPNLERSITRFEQTNLNFLRWDTKLFSFPLVPINASVEAGLSGSPIVECRPDSTNCSIIGIISTKTRFCDKYCAKATLVTDLFPSESSILN